MHRTRSEEHGTPGSGLEALFYDWHNAYRLRAQRVDVDYWIELTSGIDRLLIAGAGTGRIALPLARHRTRSVTALDISWPRLSRMPSAAGLAPVCGDIRDLPLRGAFGTIILPYSMLQLVLTASARGQALAEAARVLDKGALLHIDVSGSFDTCSAIGWHVALRAPCPEIGETVVEWERRSLLRDHVLIEKSFRTEGDVVLAAVRERWAFLRVLDLDAALDQADFDILGVDRGYGAERSRHRLIYHARRRA